MLKKIFRRKFLLPAISVGLIFIIVGIVNAQAKRKIDPSSSITIRSTQGQCVPIPTRPTEVTWNEQVPPPPTQVENSEEMIATLPLSFSSASYQVSRISDLAADKPDQEKTYIYVMHCDGSIELFKVISSGNIDNDVPLNPDDFILDWIPPASLMGSRPLFSTKASSTQNSISGGYPPPFTITLTPSTTPSPIPYP